MRYVVFKEADSWWVFKPFLRKGFSHCFYFESVCADKFWLIIDGTRSHTDMFCIPKSLLPFEELVDGNLYLEVEPQIDINVTCYTLSLNSCVDVIKRILGIRAMFMITPYQLYKRLNNGLEDR